MDAHHPAKGHAHSHAPAHGARAQRRQRLGVTLVLAAVYLVAEVVGGWWTGSLALLADAGHMLADVGALALSLFAIWLADRPAGAAHTYGYRRAEILAALANGATLVVVAVLILVEAAGRLQSPPEVRGLAAFAVATGGLVVNGIGLALLREGHQHDLNLRGAWMHLASDALGSAGAMLAGLLIWRFDWRIADPLASIAIALLVLRASWSLLRETVDVLLEAAPGHLDVDEVRKALASVAGVAAIHDLHVWTITSGLVSLSCHVYLEGAAEHTALLGELQALLRERFGIVHATLQIEPEGFEDAGDVC